MIWIESIYTTVLLPHIIASFVTLAIVLSSDIYGLTWVLGKKETLGRTVVIWLHRAVWAGLIILIGTGILLFIPYSAFLVSDFAFRLKIMFVTFLTMNAFVIRAYMGIASTRSFGSLSWHERMPLLASGTVSITGWVGAFVTAWFVGL